MTPSTDGRQAALDLAALAQASVERGQTQLEAERHALLDSSSKRLAEVAARPALHFAPRVAPRRVEPAPARPAPAVREEPDQFLAGFARRFF